MDITRALADHSIRRALGFAGLGIGMVMLSLSFDMALAFRTSADLLGVACATLLFCAWRSTRRDMRRTELWTLLQAHRPHLAGRMSRAEAQAVLSRVMRERLIWHAERVGAAAVAFWVVAAAVTLFR